MKNFILYGMAFTENRHTENAKKNIKKGFYSTSFNADIMPLIHLHLAKAKKEVPFKDKPKPKVI